MKLYISGPMTGHVDLNRPKFEAMFQRLRAMGHEPVTSFDICENTPDYRTALANDIDYICSEAEGMVMLYNWQKSPGAHAENATALAIKMPIWWEGKDGAILPGDHTDTPIQDAV